LHEGDLRIQLPRHNLHEILVDHGEVGILLLGCSLAHLALSVLEVDGELHRSSTLLGKDVELVHEANLLGQCLALRSSHKVLNVLQKSEGLESLCSCRDVIGPSCCRGRGGRGGSAAPDLLPCVLLNGGLNRTLEHLSGDSGEKLGSELCCCLHVALDLHLSLHECDLGVQFTQTDRDEVAVHHGKGRVCCALLSSRDGSLGSLQIDSP